jgi:hypothetical protein
MITARDDDRPWEIEEKIPGAVKLKTVARVELLESCKPPIALPKTKT